MRARIRKFALLALACALLAGAYGFSRSSTATKDSVNAARASRDAERIENLLVEMTKVDLESLVGSSRVDLQACKLEYSIVSPK